MQLDRIKLSKTKDTDTIKQEKPYGILSVLHSQFMETGLQEVIFGENFINVSTHTVELKLLSKMW